MKTRIVQNDSIEPAGRGLNAFPARHQMVLFVLLTYLISWSFVIQQVAHGSRTAP